MTCTWAIGCWNLKLQCQKELLKQGRHCLKAIEKEEQLLQPQLQTDTRVQEVVGTLDKVGS